MCGEKTIGISINYVGMYFSWVIDTLALSPFQLSFYFMHPFTRDSEHDIWTWYNCVACVCLVLYQAVAVVVTHKDECGSSFE